MASKFSIGDKVDQASSNHAEGTVVAIFTDRAGECRYAVEMFGHRTIQIASETSSPRTMTKALSPAGRCWRKEARGSIRAPIIVTGT
jgi:hypothetical protein